MSGPATARPPPDGVATVGVYRRIAPVYDGFRRAWSRLTRPVEEALDALFRERIGPATRVLELAPGTGVNITRLRRCAPDFETYLGVDASEEMLARARERAAGEPRIELRLGDATRLGETLRGFDFIVCTWLLSHLDRPNDLVRDVLESLSPGATAVFVCLTSPRGRLARQVLACFGRPLRYRFVELGDIAKDPAVERLESHAGGMATLLVLRGRSHEG